MQLKQKILSKCEVVAANAATPGVYQYLYIFFPVFIKLTPFDY